VDCPIIIRDAWDNKGSLPGEIKGDVDDRRLVRRAQRGDQEAFAELVTHHQRYVYNLAYRLLRDADEAEDLAQEAFLRAWKGLGGFRGRAKFTTWLYRIVTNLCYNRLAGLRRQLLDVGLDEDEDYLSPLALSSDGDPPAAIEAVERRAFLHRQIAALPSKYRLVITLFYLQEFSYQEIAQVLDLPLGTVKTHLFRARERLKRQLQAGEGM
jgi:RNA polymerase sigma-70 factor (ECF subfamily)